MKAAKNSRNSRLFASSNADKEPIEKSAPVKEQKEEVVPYFVNATGRPLETLGVNAVEKNGKVWLRIFITHSRIVERKLLLRDSGFTYTREERLSEIYMVPISKEFKLESPIKSDSTEDYSNWGMTKEGTPCIHPTDANFLDYVPMPAVVPFPDHFIVEHYIMHHDGKLPSSLAEAAKYIYSRR